MDTPPIGGQLAYLVYVARLRILTLAALTTLSLSSLTACNDDDSSQQTSTSSSEAPTTETTNALHTTATPSGTSDVSVPPTTETVSHLKSVTTEQQGTVDRVIFEFDGDKPPGYSIGYTTSPLSGGEEGSKVVVQGAFVVKAVFAQASGVDLTGGVHKTYSTPDQSQPAGANTISELTKVSDFEGDLTWAFGLRNKAPFTVTTGSSPARVVLDFQS